MKRIIFLTFTSLALMLAAGTECSAQKITFGYLNYTKVLHSMPDYATAQTTMQSIREQYDKEAAYNEDKFFKMYSDYIQGQKTFPEDIMLKRQKIQAESMAALDEKTNEMLIKNAQNSVEIGKRAAQLTAGSSIKVETLEKSWQTIMSGIDETRAIQENAHAQRLEDQKRLQAIKDDFNQKYHMPKPKN